MLTPCSACTDWGSRQTTARCPQGREVLSLGQLLLLLVVLRRQIIIAKTLDVDVYIPQKLEVRPSASIGQVQPWHAQRCRKQRCRCQPDPQHQILKVSSGSHA